MSNNLLDDFLASPALVIGTIVVLMTVSFSVPAALGGMLIYLGVKCIKRRYRKHVYLSIALIGALLALLAWLIDEVTLREVHRQSMQLIQMLFSDHHYPRNSLIQEQYSAFILFSLLSALPYALIAAGGFNLLQLINHNTLNKEVKRIGKGQLHDARNTLPKAKLLKHLRDIKQAATVGGTILGINTQTGEPVTLLDKDANLHTLAVGTTGSGKTTGIANIVESAIQKREPLIYVDGKGDLDLANRIKQFAKMNNVPFYLFSMVGESCQYNPLANGGYTSKKDRIIELRVWSEDHYRKIAEGYLQAVFKVLDKCNIQVDLYTLSKYLRHESLYLLIRECNKSELVSLIEPLENKWRDISSLASEIENIAQSEIGELFNCKAGNEQTVLTLDAALKQKAIVYFCLQPLAFPAYAETLGKLIINDIKCLAASLLTKGQPTKLYTIFDEFSVFAGDQIINLINQGRGAGIHAVLATQSLSDIVRKGDEALLGQVLNNTNNYLIQRQNNPADAEMLSNIIGTETQFQVTSQISTEQTGANLGSVKQTKEFIIHPDEIKRLRLGEAIMVNKQNFRIQSLQFRAGGI